MKQENRPFASHREPFIIIVLVELRGEFMKTKMKVFIILTVAILSLLALVIPRYTNPSEFHVTNQPLVAFEEAQLSGKPIFLDFYAKW